jgi:hypothetical protein
VLQDILGDLGGEAIHRRPVAPDFLGGMDRPHERALVKAEMSHVQATTEPAMATSPGEPHDYGNVGRLARRYQVIDRPEWT